MGSTNLPMLVTCMVLLVTKAASLNIDVIPIQPSFTRSEQVVVTVRYENNGPDPVCIRPRYVPNGIVYDPILTVTLDGEPVTYLGRMGKMVADSADNCIPVQPGDEVSTNIDVSSDYDLTQDGEYKISLNADATTVLFDELENTGVGNKQKSESGRTSEASVSIEGRPNVSKRESRGLSGYKSCSSRRKTLIQRAFSSARTYATNAYSYLLNTTPDATPRFTTWFGSYTIAQWDIAQSHFLSISNSLANDRYVIDCSCTDAGVYAYVYPSWPYNIFVCGAFWAAPNTGTDSRAGTLIHEASHFYVVIGTNDYAYGQWACQELAINNPTNAVMNADSHEYFAENTPYQA